MSESTPSSTRPSGIRASGTSPADSESECPARGTRMIASPAANGTPSSSTCTSKIFTASSPRRQKSQHDSYLFKSQTLISTPYLISPYPVNPIPHPLRPYNIMAYELTSQDQLYSQAVNAIKAIKLSNQRLAKDPNPLQEALIVSEAQTKVEAWLNKMDNRYLEPQTAFKIQIMRDQLKNELQKHRSELTKIEENLKRESETREEEEGEDLMRELEFDFEHENHLVAQKSRELKEAHSKLQNIHGIVQDTQKMTLDQGKNLDFISENMLESLDNTKKSNSYLQEASKDQAKSQKKYVCLLMAGGLLLAIVILFVVFL